MCCKLSYPAYMVPHRGLLKEVKIDNLLKEGDVALARRVDREFETKEFRRMSDGTYVAKMDSSLHDETFEHIPKMSMTMLRQSFPIESAKYDLKMKPEVDDWNGGVVFPCSYRGKAIKHKDSFLIVYNASLLHNQPAEYQRKFDNKKMAEQVQENYKGLKEVLEQGKYQNSNYYKAFGRIYLKHSPTNLNYWHYELILENAEGEIIKNVKTTGDQQNMKPTFVEYVWNHFLNKQFWIDENHCEDVPENCFYDTDVCLIERWAAGIMKKLMFVSVPIVKVG